MGLTGGIASGKSYVLARLAARGLATIDLDRVARDVVAAGTPGHDALVSAFGPGILAPGGGIDRTALGAIVFSDEEARSRLNAVVHPLVRAEESRLSDLFERSGAGVGVVVTDAALLVEAGAHLRFDRLVVVHCRPDQQLARLQRRNGLDAAAAQARIDAQMPQGEKRLFGHYDVDAAGTPRETEARADRVAESLVALAGAPGRRPPIPGRALGALARSPRVGPRGLSAAGLAGAIAEAGGLEMGALAARLEPPASGPWYRAARPSDAVAPWTLSAPLAIWAATRSFCDPPYVASAAATLGVLTHPRGEAVSDACLATLALWRFIAGEPPALSEDLHLAEGWGGAKPSIEIERTIESVWAAEGPSPTADRGLADLLGGAREGNGSNASPEERRVLDRLLALVGRNP